MRVFIAITLEDEMKKYIAQRQATVKNLSIKGNFTRTDNFHLTLRFIGEVNENQIQAIKKAMDDTANAIKPFELRLGQLGQFPRREKKIVWIGIHEGRKPLQDLFESIESHLEKEGFEREGRGLKPHITLGREIRLKEPFEALMNEMQIQGKKIPVEKIALMESKRVEGILKYIPIYTKTLNG
ncbi:RNA 2',3'-cyclic phosphodiesterase [Clostridiaceae bacterium 35-E11]